MISGFQCPICGKYITNDDEKQLSYCEHYPPQKDSDKLLDEIPDCLKDLLNIYKIED